MSSVEGIECEDYDEREAGVDPNVVDPNTELVLSGEFA
jgi:hypothetical protein